MKLLKLSIITLLLLFGKTVSLPDWQNLSPEWITVDSLEVNQFYMRVSCLDSNNCAGLVNAFPAGNSNYVKITNDAGNKWVYALRDTYFVGKAENNYKDKYYPSRAIDIAYITKNIIILALDSGRIMRTDDAGITWTKTQLPVKNKTLPVVNLKFVNENTGIANAIWELFLTTDKGVSWNKINVDLKSFSAKLSSFMDIWLTDENNIFASCVYDTSLPNGWEFGIQNYIHSSNQGKDWTYLKGKTDFGAIIQFVDNKTGYSTGGDKDPDDWYYRTCIYKTTDGGDSWNRIYYDNEIDYQVSYMKFFDKDNGLVVTDNNIYRTSDGGMSWDKKGAKDVNKLQIFAHRGIAWRTREHPIISSGFYMFEYQSTTDVNENNIISSSFVISPNPASDFIEINLFNRGGNPSVEDIRIYDILGMEVNCGIATPPAPSQEGVRIRMDVSHLSPGVYFVRVGSEVKKFVKL